MISEEAIQFIQSSIGSVWSLRLALIMRRDAGRAWTVDALVREMRASTHIVSHLLPELKNAGLVVEGHHGKWLWRPARPDLETLIDEVLEAFSVTPFAIIEIIARSSAPRVQQFADALPLQKE